MESTETHADFGDLACDICSNFGVDGDIRARPMLRQYASFLSSQGVRHKKPVLNGGAAIGDRTGA